jgi:hypothetical protein
MTSRYYYTDAKAFQINLTGLGDFSFVNISVTTDSNIIPFQDGMIINLTGYLTVIRLRIQYSFFYDTYLLLHLYYMPELYYNSQPNGTITWGYENGGFGLGYYHYFTFNFSKTNPTTTPIDLPQPQIYFENGGPNFTDVYTRTINGPGTTTKYPDYSLGPSSDEDGFYAFVNYGVHDGPREDALVISQGYSRSYENILSIWVPASVPGITFSPGMISVSSNTPVGIYHMKVVTASGHLRLTVHVISFKSSDKMNIMYSKGTQVLFLNRHGEDPNIIRPTGVDINGTELGVWEPTAVGPGNLVTPPENNEDKTRWIKSLDLSMGEIDYDLYVYINGFLRHKFPAIKRKNMYVPDLTNGTSINIYQCSPVATAHVIDLVSETNHIVLSKNSIDDLDNRSFTVYVMPGASPTIHTQYGIFGNIEVYDLYSLRNPSTTYKKREAYIRMLQSANPLAVTNNSSNHPAYNGWGPPEYVERFKPVVYNSYAMTGFGLNYKFTDRYGRNVGAGSIGVQAGTYTDRLIIEANKATKYDKIQGFWKEINGTGSGNLPGGLSIHEDGYLEVDETVTGTITFYPLTSLGFVELIIEVVQEVIELDFVTYTGVPVNLTSLSSIDTNTNAGDALPTSIWYVQSGILYASSSAKISLKGYRISITVIQLPPEYNITVVAGQTYHLGELINAPSSITSTCFTALATSPTASDRTSTAAVTVGGQPGTVPTGYALWANTDTDGEIWFKPTQSSVGIMIASVKIITLNITTKTIYAKIGKKVNLFDYISPLHTGDELMRISSAISNKVVSQSNGDIVFNDSVTYLDCFAKIFGAEVEFNRTKSSPNQKIKVVIIPENATNCYITAGGKKTINNVFSSTIPKKVFILGDGAPIEIPPPSVATTPLVTNNPTYGTFAFGADLVVTCFKEFILLIHEGDISTSTLPESVQAYSFVPLSLTFNEKIIVRDDSNKATLALPEGPIYKIYSDPYTITSPTLYEFSGGQIQINASNTACEFEVRSGEINEGSDLIKVKAVYGKELVFDVIHKRTFTGTIVGETPIYATVSGSTITVSTVGVQSFNAPLVVKISGFGILQYRIRVLPNIDQNQNIYFKPGVSKYSDILPNEGYYYTDQNLRTDIQNKTVIPQNPYSASNGVLTADYAEYMGTDAVKFRLIKYDGKSVTKTIFKAAYLINVGSELHQGSETGKSIPFNQTPPSDLLFLEPFGTIAATNDLGGVIFVLFSNSTNPLIYPEGMIVYKLHHNVDVSQFLIVDPHNPSTDQPEVTLYNFVNISGPEHKDAFIQSTDITWKTDVDVIDVVNLNASYPAGSMIPIPTTTTILNLKISPGITSDFWLSGKTFNVIRVKEIITLESADIIQYPESTSGNYGLVGLDISTATSVDGVIHLQTPYMAFTITIDKIIASKTIKGSSQLFVKSGSDYKLIKFVMHDMPYQGKVNFQHYEDDPTELAMRGLVFYTPNPTGSLTTSDTTIGPIPTAPLSNLSTNFSTYTYQLLQSFTGRYSYFGTISENIEFNIQVVPKPEGIDTERILQVGERVEIGIIQEQFGSSTGYWIQSVTILSGTTASDDPAVGTTLRKATGSSSSGTPNTDIIIGFSTRSVFLTANKETINRNITVTDQPFQFSVIITTKPDGNLPSTSTSCTISIHSWDPSNVTRGVVVQQAGSPSVKSVKNLNGDDLSVEGRLLSIESEGQQYEISPHSGLLRSIVFNSGNTCSVTVGSVNQIVRSFLVFTTKDVFFITVFVLNSPNLEIKFKQTTGSNVTDPADLLYLAYPDFTGQLVDNEVTGKIVDSSAFPLEILAPGSTTPTTDALRSYSLPWTTSINIIKLYAGEVEVASFNYTARLVSEPTLITPSPEFAFPINKAFFISSTLISIDSKIKIASNQPPDSNFITLNSSTNTFKSGSTVFGHVSNTEGGINVRFQATTPSNTAVIYITAEKDGFTSIDVKTTLLMYNPALTQALVLENYSGIFSFDFDDILESYSIDSVSYTVHRAPTPLVPPVTPPNLEMREKRVTSITDSYGSNAKTSMTINLKQAGNTREVVLVGRLKTGKHQIYTCRYLEISSANFKIYLLKGSTTSTVITPDMIANFGISLTTLPQPQKSIYINGSLIANQTNVVSNEGVIVGSYSLNSSGGNLVLYAGEAGIWNMPQVSVQVGTNPNGNNPPIPVAVYVETIADLVVAERDVVVDIGNSVNVNVNDFIVAGLGDVIFRNWTITTGSTPLTIGGPNNPFTITNGIIKSKNLNTAKEYVFTAEAILSKQPTNVGLSTPSSNISFSIIVSDPTSTEEQSILLVGKLKSSLTFPSPIATINGNKITGDKAIEEAILIETSPQSGGSVTVTFSSTVSYLGKIVIPKFVLKSGKVVLVNIRQVDEEKDISIIGLDYEGNLFRNSGRTVISYIVSVQGNSTPTRLPNQPGTVDSIDGGEVYVNQNGNFKITNTLGATLVVKYVEDGSTTEKELTVTVGSAQHPVKTIELSPPTTISLGTNVDRVVAAGNEIEDGETVALFTSSSTPEVYGRLERRGNDLFVSDATLKFENILVQAENILSNKVNIVSMIIDINRNLNTQIVYTVPIGDEIHYKLPFIPSKVTYKGMVYEGSDVELMLFLERGIEFASVTISGDEIVISTAPGQAKGIEGFSDPIGFLNPKRGFIYGLVKTLRKGNTGTATTPAKIGDIFPVEAPLKYEVLGTPDGLNVVIVVNGNQNLLGKVVLVNGNITIPQQTLTAPFLFYATLSDGSTRFFMIGFTAKTVFVQDIKRFPVRSLTGGAIGPITFQQSTQDPTRQITVTGLYVENPQSLSPITMLTPVYGIFEIRKN